MIANAALNSADFALAMNPDGNAVVAFRGRARGVKGPRFPARAPSARPDRDIQALTYSAARGEWTAAVRLSATGQPASSPQVAIDGAGRATVAWVQGPNNGQGPTQVMAADGILGGWGKARALSEPALDPVAPALGMSVGGRAMVAWTGCRRDGAAVYLTERAGSAWSSPKVVG